MTRRQSRRQSARASLASVTLAVVLVTGYVPEVASAAPGGDVSLISHSRGNRTKTGNQGSAFQATSADGAFVVFLSAATDIVAGQRDDNWANDVFLHERATGQVTLVSHIPGHDRTTATGVNATPSISADGAFVTFTSSSNNLVPGQRDDNWASDVFLYERATGEVTLVSHVPGSAATTSNQSGGRFAPSALPSISADGSFVTFQSEATNLVPGQIDSTSPGTRTLDVFLFERATGTVTLVSHIPGSTAVAGDRQSSSPSLSAGGDFVTFASFATNLVTGQATVRDYAGDVFLFERATGTVTLVSHTAGHASTTGNDRSYSPSISGSGAFVVFVSEATDLVSGQADSAFSADVFLFERATGVTSLVSHVPSSATVTANGESSAPSISADGAHIAFASAATNVIPGQADANERIDVFLFERATREVTLASHTATSATTTANGTSDFPLLGASGTFVVFRSDASDLVAGQAEPATGTIDVFLYERAPGVVTLVSHLANSPTTTANASSGTLSTVRGPLGTAASISADGAVVGFVSEATDLVSRQRDTNQALDVFLFQRVSS